MIRHTGEPTAPPADNNEPVYRADSYGEPTAAHAGMPDRNRREPAPPNAEDLNEDRPEEDAPDVDDLDEDMPPVGAPRVVLVDDHAELRLHLRALLQSSGILVVAEAGEGAAGLEAVRATRPDVVVTDVRMPGMDGLEATKRLRADHPNLPVVVYTGDDSRTVRTLAVRAGAVAVLCKGEPAGLLVDAVCRAAQGVWGRVEEAEFSREGKAALSEEKDPDRLFRVGDQFPLGRRPEEFSPVADLPSGPDARPFGLRFAAPVDRGAVRRFDLADIIFDPETQMSVVRDPDIGVVPLLRRSSGDTVTETGSHDRVGPDTDSDYEAD